MGGQLDSKIGEVGGQLHRELGKVVVGRGVKTTLKKPSLASVKLQDLFNSQRK